jgi:uncharacterized protein
VRFEWDERKNQENIRKHGFDFQDAPEVFDSPMLTRLDDREDYGEERWIGVGGLQGQVVAVVFTERHDGEVIRIISMRKAMKYERQAYEKALAN